jgi:hypothetical protein
MANLRRSIPSLQSLSAEPPPRVTRRWPLIIGALAAVLAVAWFEGGERPLRPMAEDVALPEQPK